jgi:YD repeat-containing protein
MKYLLIISLLTFPFTKTFAGVEPRNGVFYISYTDMEFTGSPADITRSYNSNNTQTGLFGYGWRSFIETKLTALPDGTISLAWWGGGLGDYYEPAVINRKGLYEMVNAIIKNLIKNNKLSNDPVAIAEKKSYYLINHKQRAEKYIELQKNKIVPSYIPSSIPVKEWLLDVNQSITWTGKIFKVKNWADHYEFDANGNMTAINDRAYTMKLDYINGRLSRIIVNDSIICHVSTNLKGQIIKLRQIKNGKEDIAEFTYDSTANLLYSKDAGKNEYWYNYDLFHNLVRISYIDSTSMEITYDASSNRVIKLRERNNASVTYQYPYFYTNEGKINYDHYATRIKKYDSTGTLVFSQYKEFENRRLEDGSSYQYRILEETDTSYHEVLYEPEVGNARYRKKNNKEAWAAYDNKRRPSYLHINDSIYRCGYNTVDMPGYFIQKDSLTNLSTTYKYSYNEDKELTQVIRNDETFTIRYHKKDNVIEVQKDDGTLLAIQRMPDSSYQLLENYWGSVQLTKDEWKKLSDSTARKIPEGKLKTVSINPASEIERSEKRKQMQAEIRKKIAEKEALASQKEDRKAALRKAKAAEAAVSGQKVSTEERKKNILAIFYDYSDILNPKKIEHEWIWERM